MSAMCWEQRGCDEEMQSRCPHNAPNESCPPDCHYAACGRPTHVVASDFDLLLNPELEYDAAIKDICRFCEFFLKQGPIRVFTEDGEVRPGNPNRFLL